MVTLAHGEFDSLGYAVGSPITGHGEAIARQQTFFSNDEAGRYAELMTAWCERFGEKAWAFCLMPGLPIIEMRKLSPEFHD